MMIQLVVDMNLSPDWVPVLISHGWHTLHWSNVGDERATDREIMDWAVANGYVVFTHELDFGTLLALTHAAGPSVVQIRGQDVGARCARNRCHRRDSPIRGRPCGRSARCY